MTPLARSSARTWYGLVLFAVAVAAVVFCKPACVFRPDGSMYEFGLGADRSVFSFGVVVAFIAIVSAFLFAISDLVAPSPDLVAPRLRYYGGGKARSPSISIPMFAARDPGQAYAALDPGRAFAALDRGQAFARDPGQAFAAQNIGQAFAARDPGQAFAALDRGQAFAAQNMFAAAPSPSPSIAPLNETSEQRRARIWG